MLICRAIDKITDNNGVTLGYKLQDQDGNTMDVPVKQIKHALNTNQVRIPNLKITSNGRLIFSQAIPSKFIEYANMLTTISGIKHTGPETNGVQCYCKFENTDFLLSGYLDLDEVTLSDGNGKSQVIRSAAILAQVGELIKIKKQNNSADNNKILIRVSDFTNKREYLEKLGFKYDGDISRYSIQNNQLDITIINDLSNGKEFSFINTILNRLSIISYNNNNLNFRLIDSIINDLEISSKSGDIGIYQIVVYNTCKISKCDVDFEYINYINNLEIEDVRQINPCCLLCNNLNIHNKDIVEFNGGGYSAIRNINIYSESNSIYYYVDGIKSKNINLKSNRSIMFDCRGGSYQYVEYKLNMHSFNAYKTTNQIILDLFNKEFIHYISWIPEFNTNNCNIYIYNFAINGITDFKYEEDISKLDRRLGANIINGKVADTVQICKDSGIAITQNSKIEFNNLEISQMKHSKGKNDYTLAHEGIYLAEEGITEFDLTILGDIRPSSKSAIYDFNLLIRQLVNISKIKPIHIKYGTDTYNILMTSGAQLDVINKDEISESMLKQSYKEQLLGINFWDVLQNKLDKAEDKQYWNKNKYEINTGCDIQIPKEVLEVFSIKTKDSYNSEINYQTKSILNMMMQFELTNLPFTSKVFNMIKNDKINFHIVTTKDFEYENILIYRILITYKGINEIDTYLLAVNGDHLIYMTYIGELTIQIGIGSNEYMEDAIRTICKLDSVDIANSNIKQSVTLASPNDAHQMISSLHNLLNSYMLSIRDTTSKTLLVTSGNNKFEAFKFDYTRKKFSYLDANYERAYIGSITKISTSGNINNIYKTLDTQFKNSVIMRLINTTESLNNEQLKDIAEAKTSIYWQIYNSIGDKFIDLDTANKILNLPIFIEISEKEYIKITDKSKSYSIYKTIDTTDDIVIEQRELYRKLRKYNNNYINYIKIAYEVNYVQSGVTKYYVSDTEISNILFNMQRSKNLVPENSVEYYIDIFNKLNFNIRPIDFYDSCTRARTNASYSKRMKEIDHSDIHDEAIHIGELLEEYKEIESSLLPVWSSKYLWSSRRGSKGTKLRIMMCKKTGICYFVASIERYFIPILRLASYTDAMLFKRRIEIEEGKTVDDARDSITAKISRGEPEVLEIAKLQAKNEKSIQEYEKINGYQELISFISYYNSDTKLEEFDNYTTKVSINNDANTEILKGYKQEYILKYIQLGAFTIVPSIPKEYSKIKTLICENTREKIIMYKSINGLYAYEISGTNMISEYNIIELLEPDDE